MTSEKYRNVVWMPRDEVRKAMAKLGNYLEGDVNKKWFYTLIEKKGQGECIPLLSRGELVVMNIKELRYSMRSSPYSSLAVRLSTSVKSPDIFVPQSEVLPSVSKLQFQDQLMKLDSHKSMGLEDMYS